MVRESAPSAAERPWFTDLLTQHPDVALGTNGKKEQHLLHRVAAGLDDADSYLQLFPRDLTARGVDSYISSRPYLDPATRCVCCREAAPFLVLLRDPVERFASATRLLRGQRRSELQNHVAVGLSRVDWGCTPSTSMGGPGWSAEIASS